MSADRRYGVVDANCEVYGAKNLYIAGGSVFPTSSHANPTLVIVAMAIRLSRQLIKVLGRVHNGTISGKSHEKY
jgi:choline dehydrogenase-like flavoprotein